MSDHLCGAVLDAVEDEESGNYKIIESEEVFLKNFQNKQILCLAL